MSPIHLSQWDELKLHYRRLCSESPYMHGFSAVWRNVRLCRQLISWPTAWVLASACQAASVPAVTASWDLKRLRCTSVSYGLRSGLASRWLSGKDSACQRRRRRFDPWVGKILWRRKWQPTPVFFPGESPKKEEPSRLQSIGSQSSTWPSN